MARNVSSPETAPQAETTPGLDIVGLEPSDSMPIHFHNRIFDLANLSADETAYLLSFPQEVPYLRITGLPAPIN